MGKNVTSEGNPVSVEGGDIVSGGGFSLEEASTIDVVVYNQEGAAVRVLSSGSELLGEGTYNIDWDGKDQEGFPVLNGEYIYDVIAKNVEGDYTTVSTSTSGMVTGISSAGGKTYLVVDGDRIDPASVEAISIVDESEE
jgi:flagellar hook assembly protein FlgD